MERVRQYRADLAERDEREEEEDEELLSFLRSELINELTHRGILCLD
jgi:hypothetical protein